MIARFRLKKKQKNVNLEHTISDLTGRAEELEKQAEDLRRENGWLKEIVILKSRAAREQINQGGGESLLPGSEDEDEAPTGGTSSRHVPKGKGKASRK